jgi:hypothetical protein
VGFPMAFRSPVGMPFLTILAPNDPFRHAFNDLFIGWKNRSFQIDNGVFGDRDFRLLSPFRLRRVSLGSPSFVQGLKISLFGPSGRRQWHLSCPSHVSVKMICRFLVFCECVIESVRLRCLQHIVKPSGVGIIRSPTSKCNLPTLPNKPFRQFQRAIKRGVFPIEWELLAGRRVNVPARHDPTSPAHL